MPTISKPRRKRSVTRKRRAMPAPKVMTSDSMLPRKSPRHKPSKPQQMEKRRPKMRQKVQPRRRKTRKRRRAVTYSSVNASKTTLNSGCLVLGAPANGNRR